MIVHGSNKIAHLTFSKIGGAGIFAEQLQKYQSQNGLNSFLYSNLDKNLFYQPFTFPKLTGAAIFDEKIVLTRNQKNIFSLFRSQVALNYGDFNPNNFNVFHFHWITDINFLNNTLRHCGIHQKKIVWTIHDMWPLTGGCHHAESCTNFKSNCIECPQVRRIFHSKVKKLYLEKYEIFNKTKLLHLVFPSKWLKELFASVIPANIKTHVIHNSVDESVFFKNSDDTISFKPKEFNLDFVFGITATNLKDKNKNIFNVIDLIQKWAEMENKRIHILVAGRNSHTIFNVQANITFLGTLNKEEMRSFYNSIDFLINNSSNENFPMSILESIACETPVISKAVGGVKEIIFNDVNGFLFENDSDLIEILQSLNMIDLQRLKSSTKESIKQFYLREINRKYLELYFE